MLNAFAESLAQVYGDLTERSRVYPFFGWEINRIRRFAPEVFQGGRGLDVGCGVGDFTLALRKQGVDAVGLELDPERVRYARNFQVPIMEGNFDEQPFPDGTFELLVFRDFICYMNPERALVSARKLLSLGGVLYLKNLVLDSPYFDTHDRMNRFGKQATWYPTVDGLKKPVANAGFNGAWFPFPRFGYSINPVKKAYYDWCGRTDAMCFLGRLTRKTYTANMALSGCGCFEVVSLPSWIT